MSETSTTNSTAPATSPQLAELVATANRFLATLTTHPVLTEIGLSEWTTLNALAYSKSNNSRLARSMGVTKQRMNQIVSALAGLGYVDVTKSSEDSRKGEIAITEAGAARLAGIDTEFAPILATGLQGRERSLLTTIKYMKGVTQRLTPAA